MAASAEKEPVLIGIGSNLGGDRFSSPRAACEAALRALAERGVRILARSRWYRTAPVPRSDQPWFVNAVARVDPAAAGPEALLDHLHAVEAAFGRQRRLRNEARVIDLDLLAFGDLVLPGGGPGPEVPHPRLQDRAFVLLPLAELAPAWRHPVSGLPVAELIARLPPGQEIEVAG
jgi:2-amino-4-hydroxy-6-hydroxymethyldihydropteridine diphosphokinase